MLEPSGGQSYILGTGIDSSGNVTGSFMGDSEDINSYSLFGAGASAGDTFTNSNGNPVVTNVFGSGTHSTYENDFEIGVELFEFSNTAGTYTVIDSHEIMFSAENDFSDSLVSRTRSPNDQWGIELIPFPDGGVLPSIKAQFGDDQTGWTNSYSISAAVVESADGELRVQLAGIALSPLAEAILMALIWLRRLLPRRPIPRYMGAGTVHSPHTQSLGADSLQAYMLKMINSNSNTWNDVFYAQTLQAESKYRLYSMRRALLAGVRDMTMQ